MSNFIINEASDDENNEDDEGNFFQTESDNEFIDDSSSFNDDQSFYNLTNVERSYNETMQECVENFDFNNFEARNYVNNDDEYNEIDEFENFERKIDKFIKTLFFPIKQSEDSFLFAVLYAVRYHLTEELSEVDEDFFQNNLKVYEKLFALKDKLKLDLKISSFENQCYIINQILNENGLFLRV